MIGLLDPENRDKAESLVNEYGKSIYNEYGELKRPWEILETLSDIWGMIGELNEIEKYKTIANKTKSWRIKKKNKKKYNKRCAEIGYPKRI